MKPQALQKYGVAAFAFALGLTAWAVSSISGQTPAKGKAPAPAKPGPAPTTSWGTPDLQGTWFVLENVPLERSTQNAGKILLTDEEVAAADKRLEAAPGRNSRSNNAASDVDGAYNAVFNSVLRTSKRTSMVIDPPDGRIPPAPAGRGGARGGRGGGGGAGAGPAGGRGGARGAQNDNPETTAQNPRCLGVQMPFLPLNSLFAQGTVMEIVQGPKSMGIYMEDDHAGGGNRVIFIDGSPHPPKNVKSVLGDSRARWDGKTLVVETTNFKQPRVQNSAPNPDTYKMTERYTRVDSNNLKREVTFEDPETWSRPWTILIEMGKTSDDKHMIFDSACHEGNYGLTSILIGARTEEAAAKK